MDYAARQGENGLDYEVLYFYHVFNWDYDFQTAKLVRMWLDLDQFYCYWRRISP